MVMIAEYQYDFWSRKQSTQHVTLTCLMPNGLCIPLTVPPHYSFTEIKEDLWYEAQKLPLYGRLYDQSKYNFCFVNSTAELEEITQENKQLDEVQPLCAVLKIVECHNDKTEQETLNTKISQLIGKKLPTFDALNNPEVNQFRFNMRSFVDKIAKKRQKLSWKEQLMYQCPPRMYSGDVDFVLKETEELNQVYQKGKIILSATAEETTERSFKVSIESHATPSILVKKILDKTALYKKLRPDQTDEYVLKVCGRDEYLIGEHPLVKFQYIADCISWDKVPSLIAISRFKLDQLGVYDYRYITLTNHKKQSSTLTLRKKGNVRSVWTVENKFQIVVQNINDINSFIYESKRNSVEIGVLVGLFHGGKSVCEPQKCKEHILTEDEMQKRIMELNETLTFDIQVCNIPKSVKLCFAVYEVTKNSKGNKTKRMNKDIPLAWANTTVFDFRNQLKTGAMTLFMWNYAEDVMFMNEDLLFPLGTVVSNPNTSNSTSLTLTFNPQHTEENHTIIYPSPEEILNHVDKNNDFSDDADTETKDSIGELLKIFGDSISDIHEQDKQKLWKHRDVLRKEAPSVLPKLLQCIDWDNRHVVCQATMMLSNWEVLPVEKALELLDYAYAEEFVRAYAVRCLNKLTDDDLLLFLLQLVQGLKHELYLECDLVKYLLERALRNQKIGHYLFWHLKSEMQVPSVCVRFGLVLEAYCRGSQDHMEILYKQTHYLEKLKKCSEKVRCYRDKEKARVEFIDHLKELKIDDVMRDLTNPLDPSLRVKRLKFDKLKIMDSKMRPVWLVLENADPSGEDIYMIFKNGDDLRQDMLTLQMLQIMDKLWKQEGLDLRLNLYKCISMEYRVGLIEVVLNADTIANIQKEKGLFSATSAFRKGSILDWLREHNPSDILMKRGTVEFLKSCAGYCVATYVLGVGDRHSDNIMVKRNGQLFHIDFGHILGHFKEKFGFKRERVPFVLTHDFVHVINKGEKKAMEFKTFYMYCEKAFMVLRKHGEFILSLFAMMISTGLPELSSEKDLNYLRETLVLSLSDEAAKSHFQSKFNEALSNSWKTSMNWATHNISKNNKVN